MILLPDGTGFFSAQWAVVGEATHHECLDDDNGNTSYVKCTPNGRYMIIEYANPDDVTAANSGVAEADIASITSVRFLSSGRANHRTNSANTVVSYEVPSGNATQICSYDSGISYETINGLPKIYSDGAGGTDWTYSDLESLEMRVTKSLNIEVYLSYLAIEVTYVEAAAENATFFGANF